MSQEAAINSYYGATANARTPRPRLDGAITCDVCVVGAGIAGCSVALHLAERGYRVVLIEAEHVGWGASGRSGGQAIFGLAASQPKIERLVDASSARAIWDVTVAGLTLIKTLIAKHAIDCDWAGGHMHVTLKPRHERALREELVSLQRNYDYQSVRYMSRQEVCDVLATDRYTGALYDSASGHLHPLNYSLGVAGAAESQGVEIFENTRALDFIAGDHVRLRTQNGEVHCGYLALCGNSYLGQLAPQLVKKIMPVASYIVATEPLGAERARRLIANNAAISDVNWVLDYFRLSADRRLLFGGRVSSSPYAHIDVSRATQARMLRVFPQLGGVRVDYAWGGLVDLTINRAPHFGRLAPNIYYLQGFCGHGVALTGIAGALVAEAIAGTAERFDVFAKIPHRSFPGGQAIRHATLATAMLYYRLRDLL